MELEEDDFELAVKGGEKQELPQKRARPHRSPSWLKEGQGWTAGCQDAQRGSNWSRKHEAERPSRPGSHI